MRNLAESHPVAPISLSNFMEYLTTTGWSRVHVASPKVVIFEGPRSDSGNSIDVVLPSSQDFDDSDSRIRDAIAVVAHVEGLTPEKVARKIRYVDRDVLWVRNIDVVSTRSIPLNLAAKQVAQLKRLVVYAACSEHDPRPHFVAAIPRARIVVDSFHFGHTFAGSFGFTVEVPVLSKPVVYQQRLPLDHSIDLGDSVQLAPVERRVMERIVRGLQLVGQAVQEQDPRILIDQYAMGFNSEMCDAVIKLASKRDPAVEYSVAWSPKVQVGPDIVEETTVQMREAAYTQLEYASKQLRKLKPEVQLVRGIVKGLTSIGNPMGDAADRSVVIRWSNRPEGRPVDVIVNLGREEYVAAYDAHLKYVSVEVTGIVRQVGSIWRLSNPSNFIVLR